MKNLAEIDPRRTERYKPHKAKPLKIKNILVPTDFSPQSREALLYATQFAEQFGARITVIHVIEPMPTENGGKVPVILSRDREFNETRQMLEGFSNQGKIASGTLKATHVRAGQPYDQITRAAKDLKSDIIIIASHGHGERDRDVLGSTAERVVRFAPCPVLTVR